MKRRSPKEVLTSYLEHVGRHDVAGALAHLSDGFRLEFGGDFTLTKHELASALGWDAGTQGRLEWRIVSQGPSDLVVEGTETNEFLRLLGVPALRFTSRFHFDKTGLIASQQHEVDWAGASIEDALAPAVAWATANAPAELAEAYPDGRIIYSEENGRRWVALLRRWKQAAAES